MKLKINFSVLPLSFLLLFNSCSSLSKERMKEKLWGSPEDNKPAGGFASASMKIEEKKDASDSSTIRPLSETAPAKAGEKAKAIDKTGKVDSYRTRPQSPAVRAGSHDDNEEFAYYRLFVEKNKALGGVKFTDHSEKYIIKVVDKDRRPCPFLNLALETGKNIIWTGRTYSNGEGLVFSGIVFPDKRSALEQAAITVDSGDKKERYEFSKTIDGIIEIQLREKRILPSPAQIDIVFLLDTTGSMQDEIDSLREVLFSIHSRITRFPENPKIRFGLVLYRDRRDKYITQAYDLTDDVDAFQMILNKVDAGGGGDIPEDLQAGLEKVINEIKWSDEAIKLCFLLADAEPHIDYPDQQDTDYVWAMEEARKKAIKICSIGASGLNAAGEYVFRQIALNTSGQFIFLTYGERGESDGKGAADDPGKVSHHTGSNYSVKNLDDIVVDIVRREFANIIDEESIKRVVVKPEEEKDLVEIRVDNILQQIVSQVKETSGDKKDIIAFFPAMDCKEKDLLPLSDYILGISSELILKNKWFRLVEREKLDQAIKELELGMTGLTETEKSAKAGKMLSADMFIEGKLYYLAQDRVLYLKAVEVETSRIIAASRVRM